MVAKLFFNHLDFSLLNFMREQSKSDISAGAQQEVLSLFHLFKNIYQKDGGSRA